MRTSVVVRALNEERHIGRLLTGLVHQTVQPDEVVLVDSGSTDSTVPIAEQFEMVRVVHIAPSDFSFGRSLNVGCRAATGDVLVIASAHVYPLYDTWIEELIAPFVDDDVVLTYGRQVGGDRTRYSEIQVLRKWFPPSGSPNQDHPFCNNANAAVRRSAWEQLPYDEDLTGLEDLEWARRATSRGWKISYVANAPIVHVHEETWAQIVNRYRREAIAHRRIYPEQRLRLAEALALMIANVVSDWYHAVRDRRIIDCAAEIVCFRAAQFWGTYRGFSQSGPVSATLKRRFYYPRRPRREDPAAATGGNLIDYGAGLAEK